MRCKVRRNLATVSFQSGVTFLELLVTIAIIGILASIAVPYYGDYITRERWYGAADAVYGEIQRARINAIENNSAIYLVQKVSGANWCFTVTEDTSVITSDCGGGYVASTANPSLIITSTDFPDITVSPASNSILELSMPDVGVSGATSFQISSSLGDVELSVDDAMRIDLVR